MTVKLVSVNRKEGISAKNGRPWTMVVITTDQHGSQSLSHLVKSQSDITLGYKEGDVVDIMVQPSGKYLNFDPVVATTNNSAFVNRTPRPEFSQPTNTQNTPTFPIKASKTPDDVYALLLKMAKFMGMSEDMLN